MKKNIGSADRIIRLLIAAVIAGLVFTNTISGTLAVVLLAVASVLALTSLISFCPLYTLIGINSCPVKRA